MKTTLDNVKKENKDDAKIYYCDNRECADYSCMRWIKHAPFSEVITVIRCELDKHGICQNRL